MRVRSSRDEGSNTWSTQAKTLEDSIGFLEGASGARTRDDKIMSLLVAAGARFGPPRPVEPPIERNEPKFRRHSAPNRTVVTALRVESAHHNRVAMESKHRTRWSNRRATGRVAREFGEHAHRSNLSRSHYWLGLNPSPVCPRAEDFEGLQLAI